MQILNYLKNWESKRLYPPILMTILLLSISGLVNNLSAQISQCNKGIALPVMGGTVIPNFGTVDLCQENIAGAATDFEFSMVQVVNFDSVQAAFPGDYFIQYEMASVSVVDPNMPSAGVSTTFSTALPPIMDGPINTVFEPTYSDAYMITTPANLNMPVYVNYQLIIRLMQRTTAGDAIVCMYEHRFKTSLSPTPTVEAVFASSGNATATGNNCAQQPIELITNILSNNANASNFSWTLVNADPGFGGSFNNPFAQNPIFTGSINNNIVANGQSGTVTLQVSFTNEDGCMATDQIDIPLIRGIGALSCNDQINISLDEDCETIVLPDQVLEGSFGAYDMFEVVISDGFMTIGNSVNDSHINRVLTVRVIDQCTNNFCWGTLTVEDKTAPVLDCTVNEYRTNAVSGHIGVGDDRYQPTTAFPQGTPPANCMLSGAATNAFYESLEFTTTIFGDYTFDLVNATAGTNLDAAIYINTFDPDNPCINLLAADEASSSITNNPKLAVTLPVGTYTLVTYGHTNTDMGNYLWEITSPTDTSGIPQGILTMTDTITIGCTIDLASIPEPVAIDNCEGNIVPNLMNITTENFGCGRADGAVELITRTYQAVDSHGNTSGTCSQVIKYVRRTLNAVVFPPNYDGSTLPSLDCTQPITDADPSILGYPTIDGGNVLSGNACMLNVGFDDTVLPTCGIGQKVLRKWTVLDWCAPVISGVNPIEHTQVIIFEDTTPPAILCPGTIEVSAANFNCTADVVLPSVSVSDDCSGYTVSVSSIFGSINGNGGTITGFPIGSYDIKYTARDSCGNASNCTTELIVTDETVPVPVCTEFLTTSLTTTGTATVPATSFDAGSFDNCCLDRFEVRRSNRPVRDFDASVTFDCGDLSAPVEVVVRVLDCFGNENECTAEVRVDDKINATLTCPPTANITCEDDIADLTLTGNATVFNGCTSTAVTFTDIDNRNPCGIGNVIRRFQISTSNGVRRCNQTITVTNSNPFDPTTIVFPRDTTFMDDCGRGLDPDDLMAPYDFPTFSRDFCADIFVGFEDDFFERVEGACFKVFRNWQIIDWCVYDPDNPSAGGIWTHRQELVVMDSQGPNMTCERNIVVDVNLDCVAQITIDTPMVIDCSPIITFDVTGDFNDFGTFDGIIPGNYEVTITSRDGCGNSTACNVPVIVRDLKAPSARCRDLNIDLNPTWAIAKITAEMLSVNNTDNCGGPVRLSLSTDINDTCKIFTCVDIGVNMVNLYVWDEFDNNDFCIAEVDVQDNFDACGNTTSSRPSIAGSIKNENDLPIRNIEISLNDANRSPVMTDFDGQFIFDDLEAGNDYSVFPYCNDDFRNGVSTFDVIQISRHILNEATLDSPYKLIAADANKSGSVTTLDIVAIQKLILFIEDDFPNNTSWRFIHRDYDFPISTNPWSETFPELYSVNNIAGFNQVDFVGVKIGDLNGDADMSNIGIVEDRSFDEHLNFNISNTAFKAGARVQVDFTAANFESLLGYQSTIRFDEKTLELEEIIPGVMTGEDNFGKTFVKDGIITTAWHSAIARTIGKEEVLFSFVFKAKEAGQTFSEIWFDNSLTSAEAYRQNGEVIGVQLDNSEAYASIQLFQNEPNPFNNQTIVKFYLPQAKQATLVVTDVSGKVVQSIHKKYEAGMNQEVLNKGDLLQQGIYYYRLQTNDFIGVKKMLLIE